MYIKVSVTAGSKKEKVEKTSDSSFCISVKEKAKQNLANNRIREIMSKTMSVPVSAVRIISGHHSPKKMLSIDIKNEK